ncbi:MAG: preprotein translocase subunit SecG [Candidatus Binatia bacterium]
MWTITLNVVHIFACIFLIVVVLLQTGKGTDVNAVFGGSSQTMLGTGAGNFLTKMTTAIATIFMLTSLILTYGVARETTKSVFDAVTTPAAPTPSVTPEATPSEQPAGSTPAAQEGTTSSAPAETPTATTSAPSTSPAPAATATTSSGETTAETTKPEEKKATTP